MRLTCQNLKKLSTLTRIFWQIETMLIKMYGRMMWMHALSHHSLILKRPIAGKDNNARCLAWRESSHAEAFLNMIAGASQDVCFSKNHYYCFLHFIEGLVKKKLDWLVRSKLTPEYQVMRCPKRKKKPVWRLTELHECVNEEWTVSK